MCLLRWWDKDRAKIWPLKANCRPYSRIVVVGGPGVGKSTFVSRQCFGGTGEVVVPEGALFVETTHTPIEIDGKQGQYQLVDTSSDEEVVRLRPLNYPSSCGMIVLYNGLDKESFVEAGKLVEESRSHLPGVPYFVIATHDDRLKKQVIEQGRAAAARWGACGFWSVDARDQERVRSVMVHVLNLTTAFCCYGTAGVKRNWRALAERDIPHYPKTMKITNADLVPLRPVLPRLKVTSPMLPDVTADTAATLRSDFLKDEDWLKSASQEDVLVCLGAFVRKVEGDGRVVEEVMDVIRAVEREFGSEPGGDLESYLLWGRVWLANRYEIVKSYMARGSEVTSAFIWANRWPGPTYDAAARGWLEEVVSCPRSVRRILDERMKERVRAPPAPLDDESRKRGIMGDALAVEDAHWERVLEGARERERRRWCL